MRRWGLIPVAAAATAVVLYAVTINGSLQVLGTLTASIVDFTGSASTAPMKSGTVLPAACSVGQAFFKTDAAAGQNIYLCTADNTWTQVQGGGGGGSFDWKPDSRYIWAKAEFLGTYWSASSHSEGGFVFTRSEGSQNLNNPTGGQGAALTLGTASISTTTTSGNRTRYSTMLQTASFTNSASGLYGMTTVPWEIVVVFRWPTADYLSNSTTVVALGQDSVGWPPRGMGVRYIDGTDTYLTLYSSGSDGSWGGTAATTVTPGTEWHRLKIRSDGTSAYKVWVSIDGGPETDVCPSGCTLTQDTSGGSVLTKLVFAIQTAAAEANLFQLDYVHFWLDRGLAR